MSLSLCLRKAFVWGGAAGLLASVLTAQAVFVPLGGEVPVTGILPGNQSGAHASIGAGGGFLVWSDNVTDGNGEGISAVGLNSALVAAQAPFRVNTTAAGDQVNPKVALLKEGGAVFVWVSGQPGSQGVYARFLGKDNTWVTGEILISAPGKNVQGSPSVIVLSNGNVLVTYSSNNQRTTTSMLDVFAQVLTPAGAKAGAEISVNQFASYNQRNPSAAPLNNGGFVVAWVTEQQRRQAVVTTNIIVGTDAGPSVDIYARAFSESGVGAGNEILVNTNGVVCANPALATAPDGGFIVAWSQGNSYNKTNDWDVAARAFSSISAQPGDVVTINSFKRGRQHSPTISSIGSDFLIAWMSVEQDGSGDGVYAQALTPALTKIGGEFRVNTSVRLDQNQPFATSDKASRFLVLWRTGSWGEHVTIETCGQLYAQPDYQPSIVSSNYVGPVFVSDPGNGGGDPGTVATLPTLDFPVTANFGEQVLLDAFPRSKGNYYGLMYDSEGVTAQSGYVTAALGDDGRFSIRFSVGARTYTFASKFDWDGKASKQIPVTGRSPIVVNVQVDMMAGNEIKGTFTDGPFTRQFLIKRASYSKAAPCTLAGRYNISISAPDVEGESSAAPLGNGFGSIVVYADGKALFSGKLADGTVVTQNAAIAEDGTWALYCAPYYKRGAVLGWIKLSKDSETFEDDLVWVKPPSATRYYPQGFTGKSKVIGSRYIAPVGKRALEVTEGAAEFIFGDGTFTTPLTCPVTLALNNTILDAGSTGVRVVLSVPTGTFTGSFISPTTNLRVSFSGKVLTGQNAGYGFFLDNKLSGKVLFTSPAP